MGRGWQVEMRRYGRRSMYRTFREQGEAERYAAAINEEADSAQQFKAAFENRYSAFVVAWQFAGHELRNANYGEEPSDEEIADYIAKDERLLKLARMSFQRIPETPEREGAPWDATTIIEHFIRLRALREAYERGEVLTAPAVE
jgi:hypothetical protein